MTTRFLLCIGCHKGGTTWLAEYLRGAPDVRLGVRKEMHALDVHFLESNRDWYARRIAMEKDQLLRLDPKRSRDVRIAHTTRGKIERYEKAQELASDLNIYAEYFRSLADRDGVDIVADLTPDYARLGAEHWSVVKRLLETHGFNVKILFIMRDPVSRIESSWRMAARDADSRSNRGGSLLTRAVIRARAFGRHAVAQLAAPRDADRFRQFASDERTADLSNYQSTIAAVDAVFPAADVHYEFYETLFSDAAVQRINGFIGAGSRPADFSLRVNASPLDVPVPALEIARIRRTMEPTYAYCADRFGAETIKAIWRNY